MTKIIGARFAAGMLVALLALTACSSKSTVKPEGAAQVCG
jgi:hypothetical protein